MAIIKINIIILIIEYGLRGTAGSDVNIEKNNNEVASTEETRNMTKT
jgi:hypothetical protein